MSSGLSRLKPKKEFELIVPQEFSARSQNYVPTKLGNPKPLSQCPKVRTMMRCKSFSMIMWRAWSSMK